jgi:hypothetical protein
VAVVFYSLPAFGSFVIAQSLTHVSLSWVSVAAILIGVVVYRPNARP